MKAAAGLAGGLAGTITVALIHEALKKVTPDAPPMDILNVELIRKGMKLIDHEVPGENKLWRWSVVKVGKGVKFVSIIVFTLYCGVHSSVVLHWC